MGFRGTNFDDLAGGRRGTNFEDMEVEKGFDEEKLEDLAAQCTSSSSPVVDSGLSSLSDDVVSDKAIFACCSRVWSLYLWMCILC